MSEWRERKEFWFRRISQGISEIKYKPGKKHQKPKVFVAPKTSFSRHQKKKRGGGG